MGAFSLIRLKTVDSTNRFALDGAGASVADRTWIVAEEQTGGRGRHGRLWHSPPGNLYATLLLIDPCPVALSPRLGFVAGLAVAEAAQTVAPELSARLKWPNDLVVDGAKLSGILLEGRMLADGRQAVAIGIGVNVSNAPEIDDRRTTSLSALGFGCDRDALFAALADAMARNLAAFRRGQGFEVIRATWIERALAPGTLISVTLPDRKLAGGFAGIDATGRLALDTPDGLVHVEAGDVFIAGHE